MQKPELRAITEQEKDAISKGIFYPDFHNWLTQGLKNPTVVLREFASYSDGAKAYQGSFLALEERSLHITPGLFDITLNPNNLFFVFLFPNIPQQLRFPYQIDNPQEFLNIFLRCFAPSLKINISFFLNK